MYAFCLFCPSSTFALQHGGFVPREWLAAKGLLIHKEKGLVWPMGAHATKTKGKYVENFQKLLACYFHAAWRKLKPIFALKTLDMGYLGQESKFSS